MRKLFFIIGLIVFVPSAVLADGTPEEIVRMVCGTQQLKHRKNADIGADYVAGVDVRGKEVAPADILASDAFQPVIIPITIDLAQRFGLQDLPAGAELKPTVGQMEIFQDGRIAFNGRFITGQIKEFCVREQQAQNPRGQGDAQDVPSGGDTISGAYPENNLKYND